ncbi:hypothetical protein [Ovoidimarina sediminis]|uniref:hypothetical protein n=1 Tax=Ovoidimarina sediminis TaxID=3079856 RepID=UPI00290D31B1|nr:hypothetical protein [Rhodophyticola sp. MJ-SS7]MDU8943106.1 hypothetical protein [Rhodophyticola sp. MJ-SS7]
MLRALAVLCLSALPALADPVPFREIVELEGVRFTIPMSVTLVAADETEVVLTFDGDLGQIQDNLPGLLSQVVSETCEERTAVAVTGGRAEGAELVLEGQLQFRRWACPGDDAASRIELLRQTADVTVRLRGEIRAGCLQMRVVSAKLRPDGLTGAFLNVTGWTERLTRELGASLNEALGEEENCIRIPPEFAVFDTRVTGGGFREIGEGRIGARLRARMVVDAEKFIRLVHLLGREGRLGD